MFKSKTAGAPEIDQKAKEAYFTASQGQLILARFKSNRTAMIAAWALIIMIMMGLFAPFLSPYDPTINGRDKDYENGAPEIPRSSCSRRLLASASSWRRAPR